MRRLAIVVTILVTVIPDCGRGGPTTLGGAELLAAGGNASWTEIWERTARLDDLPLVDAYELMPSADGDELATLFDLGGAEHLVTTELDGTITAAVPAYLNVFAGSTAADPAPDGTIAFAGDTITDDPVIRVRSIGLTDGVDHDIPFWVGAVELSEDGSVLAGGLDDGQIARVTSGGGVHMLLGPQGSGAQVTIDQSVGPVVAIAGLPDRRVAFVAHSDGDNRLYILDGRSVRTVPAGDDATSPVAGTGVRPQPEPFPFQWLGRLPMTPLAPSPDGRVLTVGLGPEDDPQIALVDVDTGDVEVLAVLDGVEPTIEEPVSAAIVGDDLVFLARHQLWRLPDVIDHQPG